MSYKIINKNKATIVLNEAQMMLGEERNTLDIVFDDFEDIIEVLEEYGIEKENLWTINFNR